MLSFRFDILIPSIIPPKSGDFFNLTEISVVVSVTFQISLPHKLEYRNENIPQGLKNYSINNVDTMVYGPSQESLLVQKALNSFERYENAMELCEEGVGGTYFVRENNEIFAVFKPIDEEPGAENNPKKIIENPLLPPGGGAKREVAAYLIDNGRAGVPETNFIDFTNKKGISKNGSIQKYIPNIGDSGTMSSSRFLTSDVHNIGILDIRLFNMDRNSENLLVQKIDNDVFRLVPIDHTYILPPTLDSAWFEWQYWRQAKEPFSHDNLKFISEIDVKNDADILRKIGIEEESIHTMIVSTILLKIGASEGLNLFEIASMICRRNKNHPSELEELVAQARKCGNFNFHDDYEYFVNICKEAIAKKKRR